jgi:PPM family protein phosphatase
MSDAAFQALRWSGMTHRGHVRPNNEDAFLALAFDSREVRYLGKTGESTLAESDFLFAVSDGMGGEKSGEFASRIAVEKITRFLPKTFKARAQGISSGFDDMLLKVFDEIHHDLLKLGQSYDECRGMGATLSLVWLSPGLMYFAHIGDSRIYHLPQNGALQQVTHDHSFAGWQRRAGQINEREARTHPRRNVLTQALGAGNQFINPQVGVVRPEAGDRILICSDGVMDGLWDHHINDLLKASPPSSSMAQSIVEAALKLSGKDNTTAVVVEII